MAERTNNDWDDKMFNSFKRIWAYNKEDHDGLMQVLQSLRADLVKDKATPTQIAFLDELVQAAVEDHKTALSLSSGR